MKKCSKCKEVKEVTEFGINAARSDGLQSQCKPCRRSTNRTYYEASKETQNPKRRLTKQALIDTNQALMVEYLRSHPCVDCGNGDIRVLEFDHVRGDKSFNISTKLRDVAWASLLLEIEKCEVRCANCHKIVTGQRAGWYKARHTPL